MNDNIFSWSKVLNVPLSGIDDDDDEDVDDSVY